jgi:YegS/Rv2252/BmrU family lipid kinase
VRACLIFNPTAKGDKARRFRQHLDEFGAKTTLMLTRCAGDARRLGAQAVEEGFDTIVAAGGDGTINEVLNGIADVPDGLERARLGLLPLGTVNVFARELGFPTRLKPAWEAILKGKEMLIDLPSVRFGPEGSRQSRRFAQLAGAGLDARAVELVNWPLKKKVGPLAYIWAGLQALAGPLRPITATGNGKSESGQLVLVGNGRLYGGNYRVFPQADLRDGLLEVCVFPRVNWLTLASCGPGLLLRGTLPQGATRTFQAAEVTLAGASQTPLEVDGELVGHLPATFTLESLKLRVCIP